MPQAVLKAIIYAACACSAMAQPESYEYRYHNYAESTAMLQGLAERYPQLARLYSLGRSATGGKELWCIEIGNTQTGPAPHKPAVYFDGNQHASEVAGGEVTLFLAHYLLERYGKDPLVTELIDSRVVYIVQRADPDGAEAYMTGKIDWDPERIAAGRDADGDGKKGEDGPEDIDGDGEILRMRIPDVQGEWKPSDQDSRLMVRREKDDTSGIFYRVLDEGIDNDKDGKINEDPPFSGFISNRNYPAFWASGDGRYRGSGDYPLQEYNARLLVNFILSRPHISQLESFHTTSGIHLRPYAARPDTDFPPQDLQDFSAVLAMGTEITSYPVASIYNDFTSIVPGIPPDEQPDVRHGVFVDWAYVHQGLFAATTELWTMEPFVNEVGWGDIPRDRFLFAIPGRYNRPDVQAAVLKWLDGKKNDKDLAGQGFRPWTAYHHPTLGAVEIGGFTRYWLRNPPPGPYFEKLVTDQARFAVRRSLTTPLVKITEIHVEPTDASQNAWVLTATAANIGYLDTSLEQARRAGVSVADRLSIELPSGSATDDSQAASFPFMRGTRGSEFRSLYRASWRVRAPAGTMVAVTISSQKGGSDRREVRLVSPRAAR